MGSGGGSRGRHPPYAESLTMVQLVWDATGKSSCRVAAHRDHENGPGAVYAGDGPPPVRGRTVLVPRARRKVWPDSPTNTRLSPPRTAASAQSRLSATRA